MQLTLLPASECNTDDSAWGMWGQIILSNFSFYKGLFHPIQLQTYSSWVNAPECAEHTAYTLIILCYTRQFLPTGSINLFFSLKVTWRGLSISLSLSLSLSFSPCLSLWHFHSTSLCLSISHCLSLWHFHSTSLYSLLPHRVQCLSPLWSGARLSSLDVIWVWNRTVRKNGTFHFHFLHIQPDLGIILSPFLFQWFCMISSANYECMFASCYLIYSDGYRTFAFKVTAIYLV